MQELQDYYLEDLKIGMSGFYAQTRPEADYGEATCLVDRHINLLADARLLDAVTH
ncbi:MAG: hypothetical protein WCD07_11040 [Burkholderiales bacterium]